MVSACQSNQNRSLGAVPALPAWSRELSAPSHLLQVAEMLQSKKERAGVVLL